MAAHTAPDRETHFAVTWVDSEFAFKRCWRNAGDGSSRAMLTVCAASPQATAATLERLAHEFGLRDKLDGTWALRPVDLVQENGRTKLVFEDPGGEPLEGLLGAPMEAGRFLRLAIGIAGALGKVHQRGLVHKDVKPANILVNCPDGAVRLTGFGIASPLPRERQAPEPPEYLAGTLAYMAPEQTGRMNRSIDSRSDLYSLGVTFYQMITGAPPFAASDPMEWVHCHVARKPVPPSERLENFPVPVSQIVMRLLAKTAEERYQTAAGVESDLRLCLAEWEAHGRIGDFPLGRHDAPDRLLIAEKLYGRAREVETLLAAFDRVTQSGAPELVLVSGYSGIGKSSVVNELQKMLVPPRRLFASGKFDQHKRDIPYSTLVQAFQSLVGPLLGKSDTELAIWRDALLGALQPNAGLMTDLIPDLKLIVGDPPPVAELEPQQAQSRFQLVFRRFIAVFARPEHPLALFLDDLQWLDTATLDLIEDLLTRTDLQHLMLIGAYRDNEVEATHPLMRKLQAFRNAGVRIDEIALAPLARADVCQLIVDTLRCESEHAAPLARMVHEKTAGNPFFVIQFLYALAEEGLLRFDHEKAGWSSDLDRIHAKGYTDNVVDLMVGKLARLPVETQQALQQLACLGNTAEITMLATVLQMSEKQVHAVLWPAVRHELIERLESSYKFMHDRVQEAAYSMILAEARDEFHLLIGRLLVMQTPLERREEAVFEIVNQLNRGAALITQQKERDQLAELNLIAGKRAKGSTAYASALTYLITGASLLGKDGWERRRDLTVALELNRAECEFLTGQLSVAEERLAALSNRAMTTVEQAVVACVRMDVCTALGQSSRAIAVGLDYLRHLGIEWAPHPTDEEARHEYERVWSQLGSREIEELVELPLMSDPASLATLDVLIKMWPPSVFTDSTLESLVICRAVNLSLERGNSDGSCVAYTWFGGVVAGGRFNDYRAGLRFGRLGYELAERRALRRYQGRAYLHFADLVLPWAKHLQTSQELLRRAFAAASSNGDLACALYSRTHLNTHLLAGGVSLEEVQREAEHGLALAQEARFQVVIDIISAQLGLIRTLRGLTRKFGFFDDDQPRELRIGYRFSQSRETRLSECWYWIRKMQARFFVGDYTAALDASSRADRLIKASPGWLERGEYQFYAALLHAVSWDSAPAGERQQHLDALVAHHGQLQVWAENCPENFENRAALVGAEIARIRDSDLDAMRLYEQAIRSARTNGFVHNEAIAHELAARFYAARGFEQIADCYLRIARNCYVRWGADGKVRQLDQMYPRLGAQEIASGPTSTIAASIQQLDLATVIKVSQAISGEMVLEKLIETLMRTAIVQAGAERGLLVLSRGAEPRIEAEATTSADTVSVQLHDLSVTSALLPETVLHHVLHTRESVTLDDAAVHPSFAEDPYIRQRQARSILCLPLINQAKLIGALYFENNLTARAFAPDRIVLLKLLASQAAISLENTRLYRDLELREARIRRLVDANIIGISIWDLEGLILEANDAFLRLVGYDRDDLTLRRLRWMDLTPAEWRDTTARAHAELKITGTIQPFEKEYIRKDGTRVPVMIGAATFEEGGNQAVAFVLDLTERKRAEQALREREAKIRGLFDANLIGIFIGDMEGQVIEANDAFLQMLGYDREDLASGRVHRTRMTPEEWRERDVRTRAELEASGRVQPFEKEYLRKDGSRVPVLIGAEVLEEGGTLAVGFVLDLTERKKAERALRESEEQWKAVFENNPTMYFMVDTTGAIVSVNPLGAEQLGYSVDELIGRPVQILFHVEDRDAVERNAAICFERRGQTMSWEARKVRKNGEVLWVREMARVMLVKERPVALIVCEDITERRRVSEALREIQLELAHANRVATMGQLTASIAHEITQPIAAARNNAAAALRFLSATPPNLDEVREALSSIVNVTDRARGVIDRIRTHVKKVPARNTSFDINDAINELVALARSEVVEKGVRVRIRLAEELSPVKGDRVQLQQVILNLILNAVEAMSSVDGVLRELSISTERSGADEILVAVRDSGPGIDPEHLERVFDAFYTTKPSGMGLGLSICRSIVAAHGGRLWADANEPRGAVFQFNLPTGNKEL